MNIIYKYKLLKGFEVQEIKLPLGSEILDFQVQRDDIVFWAIINKENPYSEIRKFRILMTGQDFEYKTSIMPSVRFHGKLEHRKTLQIDGLTLHIFEELS